MRGAPGAADHGDEVEADAGGGGHLELGADVDGAQPHLIAEEEVLLDGAALRLVAGDGEVDGVDPLVPLDDAGCADEVWLGGLCCSVGREGGIPCTTKIGDGRFGVLSTRNLIPLSRTVEFSNFWLLDRSNRRERCSSLNNKIAFFPEIFVFWVHGNS